jgi:glyoxylase-like metal-dependent hydrolase (beta-lactamase superfamily II)
MVTSLLLAFTLAAAAPASEPQPRPAPPQEVARNVYLLPGGILPGRQPDGNTVIFAAPHGLVVVDTGRHTWHSDGILAFARERNEPIAAILNTHWHLDHTSGNRRLRENFPELRVYASSAIDRAIGGFLAASAERAREFLESGRITGTLAEDVQGDLATMDASDTLRPDIVIDGSLRPRIAGKRFDVRLARHAATDGDLWLYDRATQLVVTGDLVTLPAPFLDTACPEGWRTAMADIWATPFRLAIPGHGPALTRAQFASYRNAFEAFLDCAGGDAEASECAAGWVRDAAEFLPDDAARTDATNRTTYYVGMLRQNNGTSAHCAS